MKKNNITNKFRDDRAVSPVIGEILMVAIVVILAAVISAYLFGMAPMGVAPQASIRGSVEQINSYNCIKLEHQGGDTVSLGDANIKILVEGTEVDILTTSTNQLSTGMYAYIWNGTDAYHFDIAAPSDADVTDDLPAPGTSVNVKIVDVASQQLIADIQVRG